MLGFARKYIKFLVITLFGLWALSTPFMPQSEALINTTVWQNTGPFETTVVADPATGGSDPTLVSGFNAGTILYGFKVITVTTTGVAGLYDTATLTNTAVTQGIFIDEGGTATVGNTWQSDWPAPYKLVTGLVTVQNNCDVVIYHDVK